MANKLFKVQQSQRTIAVDDLRRRQNLLYTNPNYVTALAKAIQPKNSFSFFGASLGGLQSIPANNSDVFQVNKLGVNSEYIKIRTVAKRIDAARVVGNSKVPDVLIPGQPFEVTISGGDFHLDAKLRLADTRTHLLVVGKRGGSDGTAEYIVQYNAMPTERASGSLLELGKPVNYAGNSKGEGSTTNHPIRDRQNKFEDFVNPLQITRHQVSATGSAESNFQSFVFQCIDPMSKQIEEEFVTDIPLQLIGEHLDVLDKDLLYSRTNLDIDNKVIINKANYGDYDERPTYAGVLQQLEYAPYQYGIDITENPRLAMKQVDNIMAFMARQLGVTEIPIIAVCDGAGYEWLQQVIEVGGRENAGLNYVVEVSQSELATGLNIGYKANKYISRHGTITPYNASLALALNGEYDQISYNGITFNQHSNNIYFMPAITDKKRTVDIYYKQGDYLGKKFSRALVFGHQNGMSGLSGNDFSVEQLNKVQDTIVRNWMTQSQYNVASSFDGDLWQCLSQLCPHVNTKNVARLQLLTPNNRLALS